MGDDSSEARRARVGAPRARAEANRPAWWRRVELLHDRDLAELEDAAETELLRRRGDLGTLSEADLCGLIERIEAELRRRPLR